MDAVLENDLPNVVYIHSDRGDSRANIHNRNVLSASTGDDSFTKQWRNELMSQIIDSAKLQCIYLIISMLMISIHGIKK
jgi:hypothetical protein